MSARTKGRSTELERVLNHWWEGKWNRNHLVRQGTIAKTCGSVFLECKPALFGLVALRSTELDAPSDSDEDHWIHWFLPWHSCEQYNTERVAASFKIHSQAETLAAIKDQCVQEKKNAALPNRE